MNQKRLLFCVIFMSVFLLSIPWPLAAQEKHVDVIKINDIITNECLTAAIEDANPVSGNRKTMAFFTGVRASGHTWDTTARGVVSDNVSFVAIRVEDESER